MDEGEFVTGYTEESGVCRLGGEGVGGLWRLGAVHILCKPKMGGLDPPSPPCQPKIRNWLTPLPPLSEKI